MIEFKNVCKRYNTGTEAVKNASFKIEKGEFAFTRLVCPYVKGNVSYIIRNFKELLYEHNLQKK